MPESKPLGRFVSSEWRSVYTDLREEGWPRGRSFLVATGLWCYRPFVWLFPEVDDAPLPRPRERKDG